MLAIVLFALTSSDEGEPACLHPARGVPVIRRLYDQLAGYGGIRVVTWGGWRASIASALPDDVEVVGADGLGEALERGVDAAGQETAVVLLHAHLVASDLGLQRLVDGAESGTATLVAASGERPGWPVRIVRGRVVAAGSDLHALETQEHVAVDALRIAASDRNAVVERVGELRTLLEPGGPTEWRTARASSPVTAADDAGAARPDPLALLLVATVRGGIPVAATPLPRGLVWRLARAAADASAAAREVSDVDEEAVRLDASVKELDGFFTTFLVSPYSRYWARWAARRSITPNQVTIASMAVGVAAAGAYAVGTLWASVIGGALLQLAFTLDCVDGQLARYCRRFSTFGAWLDSVFDRAKEYLVYVGLVLGGIRVGDDTSVWLLAAAALSLQTFRHTLDLGYAEQQRADVAAEVRRSVTDTAGSVEPFWANTPMDDTGAPARIIVSLRRAEDRSLLRWAKRIVILPIGERFALITVLAIVASPRLVFLVLLAWGGLATAYTFGGRLVRSFA